MELLLKHGAGTEAKSKDGPGALEGRKAFGKRDEMLTGCVSWAVWLDVLAKSSASPIEMVSKRCFALVIGRVRKASVSRGKKPVDYAKTDEIRALLRKAQEVRGRLGPVDVSFGA